MAEGAGELAQPRRLGAVRTARYSRPGMALRLVRWVLLKLQHVRRVDGILVIAFEPVDAERIETALHLIRKHDPIRYWRLAQDLERIWVSDVSGSVGQFRRSDWTCELDEPFVQTASTELIASVIVHEATHARLFRMGFGYEEAIRVRVEQICLRRELAFAAKVPGGIENQCAEVVLRSMPDLSNEGFSRRRGEANRAVLLRLGVPGWLTSLLVWTINWVHRRRARRSAGTH